jgi:P-type Ca2+ transporter type 2B
MIFQECVEGLSIFAAILLITSISAANDYVKEKQFIDLLETAKDYETSCIRGQDGTTAPVNAWELVVGDIITFEAGDRIPADCLLLESIDLKVDEAYHYNDVKTIVGKHEVNAENTVENYDAFLMAESLVVEGSGKAIILVISEPYCSRHRRVLRQDDDDTEVSPLQEKLANIGSQIGKLGIYAALILFVVLFIRTLINLMALPDAKLMSSDTLKDMIKILTTCITLVMVAVPEGLPLSVSISVAFSLSKMKKQNLLIKNADSQEIMGGVEYVITGKTGTLTKGNMRVTHINLQGTTHVNTSPDFLEKSGDIDPETKQLVVDGIVYNCTAKIEMSENAMYVPNGNGTECGMLKFIQNNGHAVQDLMKNKVGRVKTFVPWTPKRKMESTAILQPGDDYTVRVYSKGAPEVLLQKCNMNAAQRAQLLRDVVDNEMGANGIRPFAYAYKDLTLSEYEDLAIQNQDFKNVESREVLENDLELVAIFGLRDELRNSFEDSNKTVAEDIKFANKGKINVIMVSGDNLQTARACAIEASIVSESKASEDLVCMTGETFRHEVGGIREVVQPDGSIKLEFGDARRFETIIAKLKVLARAEPNDKLALVAGIQDKGYLVACTGEGLNDAGALKQANVGFAMGSGCELAKDQADMIILDDNFGSTMVAVSWGRNIYDNVKKFLQFQMTVNITCCVFVVVASLFYGRSPFSVLHLLWINLIMDTFAALALATEPPNANNLRSKPIKASQMIMSEIMWRQILTQSIYQLVVLLIMLFLAPLMFGFPYMLFNPSPDDEVTKVIMHNTVIFTTFIYLQLCNFFNCRKLGATEKNIFEGFFNNPIFLILVFGLFVAQYFLVQLGGTLFQVAALPFWIHACCFAFASGSFLVCLGIKYSPEELAK